MYRTLGGKQVSAGTFSARGEAKAAFMGPMAKVLRGVDPSVPAQPVYPEKAHSQITVAGFADRWIEKHDVSHNVRLTYRSCLNAFIVPGSGRWR
jgi:hypothetical protein